MSFPTLELRVSRLGAELAAQIAKEVETNTVGWNTPPNAEPRLIVDIIADDLRAARVELRDALVAERDRLERSAGRRTATQAADDRRRNARIAKLTRQIEGES